MKKLVFSLLAAAMISAAVSAQSVNDLLNKVRTSSSSGSKKSATPTSYLTNTEISGGLKEALKLGAQTATKNLSATNGFFGNQLIKILMPPEVRTIEAKMRQFGMGSIVDKAILSMNKAAEDASGQALPILVNAITSFTIQDGLAILKGNNTAATDLLRTKTSTQIAAAFRPVISKSMSKYNVEQLWSQVFSQYNALPVIKNKVNTDITGYITDKAISGLFTTVGQEEQKIRKDPAGTANDLIERVFGSR